MNQVTPVWSLRVAPVLLGCLLLGLVLSQAPAAQAQGTPNNILNSKPPVRFVEGSNAQCDLNARRIVQAIAEAGRSVNEDVAQSDQESFVMVGAALSAQSAYKQYCTEGRIETDLSKCATFRDVTMRLYDAGCYNLTHPDPKKKSSVKITVPRRKALCEYGKGALMAVLQDACP